MFDKLQKHIQGFLPAQRGQGLRLLRPKSAAWLLWESATLMESFMVMPAGKGFYFLFCGMPNRSR